MIDLEFSCPALLEYIVFLDKDLGCILRRLDDTHLLVKSTHVQRILQLVQEFQNRQDVIIKFYFYQIGVLYS